jgi:hypothetical protein
MRRRSTVSSIWTEGSPPLSAASITLPVCDATGAIHTVLLWEEVAVDVLHEASERNKEDGLFGKIVQTLLTAAFAMGYLGLLPRVRWQCLPKEPTTAVV